METMIADLATTYRRRRILVTGHTGFKGSWLCFWLDLLGADVHGLALPPMIPSAFGDLKVDDFVAGSVTDVRDGAKISAHIARIEPEVVFHLAAQPLVRAGWERPLETFDVNVMGTANVLDAAARSASVKAAVVVTTDKCYEETASGDPHREDDRLGGADPYSASKAAAELVVRPYLRGQLMGLDRPPAIATARAGNVLGGGDRAADRLIPDVVRALEANSTVTLRRPDDVRPWQHVLDCTSGYLVLGHHLLQDTAGANSYNFGPDDSPAVTVQELTQKFLDAWGAPSSMVRIERDHTARERPLLGLNPNRAREHLGWSAIWDLDRTVLETARFYRAEPQKRAALAAEQIQSYTSEAASAWVRPARTSAR